MKVRLSSQGRSLLRARKRTKVQVSLRPRGQKAAVTTQGATLKR